MSSFGLLGGKTPKSDKGRKDFPYEEIAAAKDRGETWHLSTSFRNRSRLNFNQTAVISGSAYGRFGERPQNRP